VSASRLPKLYDIRITYPGQIPTDWYGPYALTDEDVRELTARSALLIAQGHKPEIREHQCDEPTNNGCGHIREGLPAPY
jgi:hypothetical protein